MQCPDAPIANEFVASQQAMQLSLALRGAVIRVGAARCTLGHALAGTGSVSVDDAEANVQAAQACYQRAARDLLGLAEAIVREIEGEEANVE